MSDDLISRLRKHKITHMEPDGYVWREPINEDGPEAADAIEAQAKRIAELEADLNDCIKIAEEHEGCKISHIEGIPCEAGEQIADIIRKKKND